MTPIRASAAILSTSKSAAAAKPLKNKANASFSSRSRVICAGNDDGSFGECQNAEDHRPAPRAEDSASET
jgi:hypothetical protein